MARSDGVEDYGLSRFGGVVREVERNRRLVFTFRWDEGPGRYSIPW